MASTMITVKLDAEQHAQLMTAAAEPKWQPIDTAPKDGVEVLVSYGGTVDIAFYDWRWQSSDGRTIKPAHWMPLPAPPKVTR